MNIQNTPVLGGTAPRHATRTAQKLAGFALGWVNSIPRNLECKRYLDVGCGNGFITELVAPSFDEVVGIDMEEERLEDFRAHVNGKPNFQILLMSAAKIEFPNEFFPFITTFEVLEHVGDWDDQRQFAAEIRRVALRGYFITTPNRYFPIEPHALLPLYQFYPERLKPFGLRLSPGYMNEVEHISLLTRKTLQALFPEAHVQLVNFASTLIAFHIV